MSILSYHNKEWMYCMGQKLSTVANFLLNLCDMSDIFNCCRCRLHMRHLLLYSALCLTLVCIYFFRYFVFSGHQSHHNFSYFNAILIRSSTVNTENSKLEYFPFENSVQGRHFLTFPIRFAGSDIILITSHLESCKPKSNKRKSQFKEILLYMRRQRNGVNVIFGGDTNLRDKEVEAVGGLPNEVLDAWASCGSPHDAEFTWDMSENDNKDMNGAKPLRFDRIFLRPAQNGKMVRPQKFTLIGKERLSCERFASDHWGIWLEFSFD